MTVPAWDPQRFHQTMSKTPEPPRPARRPTARRTLALALALVCLGAAAVTATTGLDGEAERVGVCHATGSEANPYVWLSVKDDGYEHGHHRHHAGDFFTDADAGPGSCAGDTVPAEEPEQDGNATAPEGEGNEGTEQPTNDTAEPAPSENETAGPEGNATEEPTGAQNGTSNETVEPAPAPEPQPGDAWVRQTAVQDRYQVTLTLQVGNRGAGEATDVVLTDRLPDVRRSWALGGADAERCVLEGNDLTCWFGALAPGETAQVELLAFTDRMPCGDALTNTAFVSSTQDAETRNDASSAGIQARSC